MSGLSPQRAPARPASGLDSIADSQEAHGPDAAVVPLSALRKGMAGSIVKIIDRNENLGDEAQSTLAQRLLDIGFIRGERCEVIAETWPGRDPMAVRIGNSTFALRRKEANAVLVRLDPANV